MANVLPPQNTTDAREWARFYRHSMGWWCVPLRPGTKKPYTDDWNAVNDAGEVMDYQPEDFDATDNIGLRSRKGLVIVDLDDVWCVRCADDFLPKTGMVWGRPSKPRAKRGYLSTFENPLALKDGDGSTLAEIRVNHQDVVPPSTREPKDEERAAGIGVEELAWSGPIDFPASCAPEMLDRLIRLVCTAAWVARHYPKDGGWHAMMLALTGTLRHLALTEDEALQVLRSACRVVNDPLVDEAIVRSTFKRDDGTPLQGEKALVDATSKTFIDVLKGIWGLKFKNAHGFALNKKGDSVATTSPDNMRLALKKMGVRIAFNEFSAQYLAYFASGKGEEKTERVIRLDDAIDRQLYFGVIDQFRWEPPRERFTEVLLHQGESHSFHPVRDWLKTLMWDGTPRLDTWLIRLASAHDSEYTRAVSALPLLAAIRRVYAPGAKFDEMLVLESGQGLGKSTALKSLVPYESWFNDDLPLDADSQVIIERTAGKWIIEAADLSGLKKADVEALKANLSRTTDNSRMAYGRHTTERPRQFIIIGTTNSQVYLKDSTGNRRFWPLKIGPFDLRLLVAERDQLWAEAHHRERRGESIRLAPALWEYAAAQQERRRDVDPWENVLAELLGSEAAATDQSVTNQQVFEAVGLADRSTWTPREQQRLTELMGRLGFKRQTIRLKSEGKSAVVRGWKREGHAPKLDGM